MATETQVSTDRHQTRSWAQNRPSSRLVRETWLKQLARWLCLLYLASSFADVHLAYASPVLREVLPSLDLRSLEVDRNAWLREVLQEQEASQSSESTPPWQTASAPSPPSQSSRESSLGSSGLAALNSLHYGSLVRSPAGALLALTPAVLLVQGVVQPNSFNVQHQMHYAQSENYRIYAQLRSDPRFLAQLQNTDLILLNSVDFPALSPSEQQRLLHTMRQVIQAPVVGVTRAQEEQQLASSSAQGRVPAQGVGQAAQSGASASSATSDYAQQATALASRTLRNLPVVRVQHQLGGGLLEGLQQYAHTAHGELLGDLKVGAPDSVASCSGTRYSSVTCTKPVVLESSCTITPEFTHLVGKPSLRSWRGSVQVGQNSLEHTLVLAGGSTARLLQVELRNLGGATKVHQLLVRSSSYLSSVTAQGYGMISRDWVDLIRAWNPAQQKLSLWLTVPSKQRYSSLSLVVRVSFTHEIPPQTVKWHEADCPLAQLRTTGFTYLEPAQFARLEPQALGGARGENLPIYTVDCNHEPQPIVTGCVEVDGQTICGISNPYNPALQGELFCKELVTTWRYLATVPDDCEAKLAQATQASQDLVTNVTGIVLQQQQARSSQARAAQPASLTLPGGAGNPRDAYRLGAGNCELVLSEPLERSGNPLLDAQDPWSAGFLRHGKRSSSSADATVTGIVGVTLTYRCSAPVTNQTCVDTILSRLDPASCPLQVRVREQEVHYRLSESFSCVMGHNCPAYIQAAPHASWHRNVPQARELTPAPSGANNNELATTSHISSALTAAPESRASDIRITARASTASSAPTAAQLQQLAQRAIPTAIVSSNPQCEVLAYEPRQGLVSYRCTSRASYTTPVVQQVAECDNYQCQPGDPGCNKRTANSQSMSQVISATSILNAIQEDASCDFKKGDCQFFAGEARTCRCSLDGLVDCCNLPTNVNLNDYLQLTFALTQLTNASFQALGREARLGNWKNLGDVVAQGFSKGYQALKQPLTSAFEAAFGNGVVSSAAQTATGVAGSASGALAGTSTGIASEVAASTASGALEAMRQLLMQSLNDWITETFGADLASRIFTVEAGKIAINSSLANVFAFANNVYLAYSVGKLLLQIAYRCHEHEYATAGKQKLRSCTLVGIYCSQEVAGICLQTKTVTCCFSNRLSRILQEQIRRQLGIGFGTPEHPDCARLHTTQLSKVDWSQVNLDEWVAIMLANDNFATLSERLVEQKVFLSRLDDTTHGELATQLTSELDTRGASERNGQRLEHLASQLSLERFVEQAKLFLLRE